MEEPLFSVIVTTYARPQFLTEAIDSVLRQTVTDFEILVVDDGSPDPASVQEDPRIRLIRRDRNGGLAAARNTGLDCARGRYVTFLDDDDWYTVDRLELAVSGLQRAPIAICWLQKSDGRRPTHRLLEGSVTDVVLDGPGTSLGQTAIDRKLVPRFDERFLATQDVEWWLRAATRGPVSTVPRVGYIQRIHDAPRHLNDLSAHLEAGLLLMQVHAEYFRSHPSAAARRWLMVWQHAQALGEYKTARRAALRALRLQPHPRAAKRLVRSLRSSSMTPSAGSRSRASGERGER